MKTRPLFVHCCHCRWCQRETGASFALNAMIEADRVELLKGEVDIVDTPSKAARVRKYRAVRVAASPSGVTTPERATRCTSCASARSIRPTGSRRTSTSSLPPSSLGSCSRPTLLPSRSTTTGTSTGPGEPGSPPSAAGIDGALIAAGKCPRSRWPAACNGADAASYAVADDRRREGQGPLGATLRILVASTTHAGRTIGHTLAPSCASQIKSRCLGCWQVSRRTFCEILVDAKFLESVPDPPVPINMISP